eukprot:745263-Pyramimonas_sp.AAC.1
MTIISQPTYPVKYKSKTERRKHAEEFAEVARVLFRHHRRGWRKKLTSDKVPWMTHFPMPPRSSARGKGVLYIRPPAHATPAPRPSRAVRIGHVVSL